MKNFITKIIKKDLLNKKIHKIKTRFPPEPNGYLHIGHAISIFLNFEIAKYFKGECYLRFDDTNPNVNGKKYINSIKKDINWLGFTWDDKEKYASDYFDIFYYYAVKLIKKNLAYVDELSKEEIKKFRGTIKEKGIASPYRNRSVKKNLQMFEKMKMGEIQEGKACLRAKINMHSPSLVLRDPVLYRIRFKEHYKTKKDWIIYPTYDFSHCISDAIEGITHSLCTIEFQENRYLYNWILKNLEIQNFSKQYEFSRLNIEYNVTSKRFIKKLIKNKIIQNWKDPRILTISSLKNRGYTSDTIIEFCKKIGITKKEKNISISVLQNCARKKLENCFRVMAIINPIKVVIESIPDNFVKVIEVYNHPKKKDFGKRKIIFTKEIYIEKSDFSTIEKKNYKRLVLGKKVKLRYSYIIKAKKIIQDKFGNIVTILCKHYENKSLKSIKNIGIIHWISKKYAKKAIFYIYKNLFNKKFPEYKENLCSQIKKNSLVKKLGFIDISSKILRKKRFQFERIGYFIFDKSLSKINKTLVFRKIVGIKKKIF
ncbi:glutamine--tRNA ligase [bacterium endosymbiont of Pedicinus badii]|uniref:glutamine--tRNA ligase n=1 Tax=bacterium endosymbiont of Pedicinus badii TaxID=1719126 RepID=UPI0009BAB611|nr:glutamine--tRNA ligase [bacterium endosymbiont of Pedicinus badii]OQM34316.1 glutamine--tRNA ligase [bacterium endosymbiont of Pedicinus badii]